MALNEAYGQTDVTHDPKWIMANYRNQPHIRDAMLHNLMMEQEQQSRDQEFAIRQAGLAEARNQRYSMSEDNRAQRALIHDENLAATNAEREARHGAVSEAQATRKMAWLQGAMHDPSFKPEEQNAFKQELMNMSGIKTNTTTPAGVKGAYGPGGASTTTAPATGESNYTPPTSAFTYDAPPVGPEGTAQLDRINQLKAGGQGYVEGGQVFGGKPGMDFNTNTAEYVPHNMEGTINGKPAGQALAEGALRSGVNPIYAPSGMNALAAMRGNPAPNEYAIPKPADLGDIKGSVNGPYFSGEFGKPGSTEYFFDPQKQTTAAPNTTEYKPPTSAFTGPNPSPNPTPGGTIAPSMLEVLQNAPIVTPTPGPVYPPPIPSVNPQAGNDRTDLLNDIEGTFYGGGQAPQPTPKPTPVPPRLAPFTRQFQQA